MTCTIRQHFMENVFQNYEHQLWKDKELIIVLNKDDMNIKEWKEKAKSYRHISVFQLPEKKTLGECLNFAIKKAKYDYIAKFDDDDYYGSNYLTESMAVFNHTDASLVGKTSYYCYIKSKKALVLMRPERENRSTEFVAGGTLVFKKEVLEKVKFCNRKAGSDIEFQKKLKRNGYKIYSTSKFNYTLIRDVNIKNHTWKINHNALMKRGKFICQTNDYQSIVSADLENNNRLYSKDKRLSGWKNKKSKNSESS
ncbi:MAG: glycosyltransferase [Bacillota bacterium]